MKRFKIIICYDGNFINGWHGSKGVFVKNLLESAFQQCFKKKVEFFCSGRTDSGVHALEQTCHVDTNINYNSEIIQNSMNYKLPQFLKILHCQEVNLDFHARFSTKYRKYMYLIYINKVEIPILYKKALWIKKELNVDNMKEICSFLVGKHDFSTFCPKQYKGKKERNLDKCYIENAEFLNFPVLKFVFQAKSFAHHQIRNLMGAIIYVGKSKWSVAEFQERMSKKERCFGADLSPAYALYFLQSFY